MITIRQSCVLLWLGGLPLIASCGAHGQAAADSGAPPPAAIDHESDGTVVHVKEDQHFTVVFAGQHDASPELSVTGVVTPDISRSMPVVSLVSGRVVDLRARLGDRVDKGQVLARIHSADISSAVADYLKAAADEVLTDAQLQRAAALYERGAMAKKDLEVARDARERASVDLATSGDRLRLLGGDPEGPPSTVVDVVAPASGVITEQNVTAGAAVKSLDNSPNLFTIADLSRVWILCDVRESDLPVISEGDKAEVHLAAYPDSTFSGRIDNIAPVLDPTLRTAKVRVEVHNPGILRIGMFVTATFRGHRTEVRASVPASAILHLHDREWVYVAHEHGEFRRTEVVAGTMLQDNMQEVRSGLQPGERVVANALIFQDSVAQ
jgi:cobalt-zinc-cadmium efflux system membrane fusion protein